MNKNKIRKIAVCLCAIFWVLRFESLPVTAAEAELKDFGVTILSENNEFSYSIKWWKQAKGEHLRDYYITLPYSVREQNIKVNYIFDKEVFLNGERIEDGIEIPAFTEGENILTVGENDYNLFVIYGSNIPTVHIATESGNIESISENKEYKESGFVSILENNQLIYSGELEYIKGRGNYTWSLEKKPFNIKLKEKQDLFGMGKSRKWSLLANYLDPTRLKNKLGYDFAETVGIEFSPQAVLVDVYINNEYMGHYTLCERIEIDDGRVDITDLEKLNELVNSDVNLRNLRLGGEREKAIESSTKWVEIPNSPEIVSGGYLIELELDMRYDDEKCGFVSAYGQPVIIKSPEHASQKQVEYISHYYQEMEDALLSSDGYNSKGKHYSEYIDMESFVKMYVFQEFIKNLDAGTTSFFMYKDVGKKLVAGPVWDLDAGFGRTGARNGIAMGEPTEIWAGISRLYGNLKQKHTILSLLCRHNDFKAEAQKQWETVFLPNIGILLDDLNLLYQANRMSIISDECKWKTEGAFLQTSNLVEENILALYTFINERSEYMSEVFSDRSCAVEYQANGGAGCMYDLNYYKANSTLELMENSYTNGDKDFLGWNTRKSGWGQFYADGSEIVLEEDLTLYAQWEKTTVKEKLEAFWLGITGN